MCHKVPGVRRGLHLFHLPLSVAAARHERHQYFVNPTSGAPTSNFKIEMCPSFNRLRSQHYADDAERADAPQIPASSSVVDIGCGRSSRHASSAL
uniref:Putative secreted protein n=1 Tax=Rhipicephalus microplus TaxID=6941 RepID=A0A6M2D9G4_RHIMP